MVTAKDLIWLAGLLEGEAYFGSTWRSPMVSIGMADRDVIQRARDIMGATWWGEYKRGRKYKKIYRCYVTGPYAAGLMMTVYSLMGIRRKWQIALALSKYKPRHMLSQKLADEVRDRYISGENVHITAKAYNISRSQVWRIGTGKRWYKRAKKTRPDW